MNNVFRVFNPVYATDTFIFRVDVFTKQPIYEYNTVFSSSFRVFIMYGCHVVTWFTSG